MNILLEQAGYQLNEELKIWSRPDYSSINYSDGDTTELRIKYLIDKASDVSVFSDELRGWCTDWPSLYYLSSTRANLIRVFDADLSGDVLEIGAGCGAITRYLGEQGGNVLALEGSTRRASIARARTRDLPNVSVLAESFESFDLDKKFDVITLIGVFEYANLFISGDNPGVKMLQRVRSLLKPDGLLIIAIENQLGLKYFAGAPEDHVSVPMFGIEGRYGSATPQTYGKQALQALLDNSGFTSNEFFAPFPDYKLPVSIITEKGFAEPDFDAGAFAWQSAKRDPQLPEFCSFSLELAWPEVVKNGLGMDMANSFLIGASPVPRKTLDDATLAFHYSSDRRSMFCKSSEFRKDSPEGINVYYRKLGADDYYSVSMPSVVSFNLTDAEPYIKGAVLSTELIRILNSEGWTYVAVGAFLRSYIEVLKQLSGRSLLDDSMLPGIMLDAVPQNIVIDKGGLPHLIDKEWEYSEDFRLEFLLFRTLQQLLGSITRVNQSPTQGPFSKKIFVFTACEAAGYPINERDVKEFLFLEASLQSAINGRDPSEFLKWGENDLVVQDNLFSAFSKAQSTLGYLETSFNETRSSLISNSAALNAAQVEVERLSAKLAESELAYTSVVTSNSWVLTKPLRFFMRLMRNRKGEGRAQVERLKQAATAYLRGQENVLPMATPNFYLLEAPVNRLRNISVILPIYKDVEMTKRCILAAMPGVLSTEGARLVAINDGSPDAGMLDMLLELQKQWPDVFFVLDNEVNLGFVKTVNRGMRYVDDDDVVLLNSDVIVPDDWLARLAIEAYIANRIGTVTPFSNNATICSFPAFLLENEQAFGLNVSDIDKVFKARRLPNVIAPTGVGFCMYIRRDCLTEIGLLNEEKFGRGYGEENDLCQRALKAGWSNIITPNLYAFHEGGVSFSTTKAALIENAFKAIVELHPDYHLDIQKFIAADPLKAVRVKRLAHLISTLDRPKVLHVTHEAGGGVKQHLEELAQTISEDAHCMILSPYKGVGAVSLRLGTFAGGDELVFQLPSEYPKLIGFLKSCQVSFVHYHHSLSLNPALFELPTRLSAEYALSVHDFYWLNGNPTLSDEHGVFPGECRDDVVNPNFPLPEGVSPEMWRDLLRGFVEGATAVIFPSESTYSLYKRYYALPNALVAFHIENGRDINKPVTPLWRRSRYKVGVLGALSKEKGADYLELLAQLSSVESAPLDFVLIGFGYRNLKGIHSTGRYDATQLSELIKEHDIDLILFPCQWPETYSYTLSYALESGLPIIAPDIGVFPERLSDRECTLVYNFGAEPAELLSKIRSFVAVLEIGEQPKAPHHPNSLIVQDFYTTAYPALYRKNFTLGGGTQTNNFELPEFSVLPTAPEMHLRTKEIVLLALWTLYRKPWMNRVCQILPYGIRQKMKRKLTKRPLHEIVDLKN